MRIPSSLIFLSILGAGALVLCPVVAYLGIDPLPYARAPWRDSVKLFAAKTLRRLSV